MATVIPFPLPKAQPDHSPERGWTGSLVDLAAARAMAAAGEPDEVSAESTTPREARDLAVRALAVKGRSVAEMRARLLERGIEPEVVSDQISRLESEGLLNDHQLAEDLARTLHQVKKLGPSAIRQALAARLVPLSIIGRVVADLPESSDALRELAESRMRQLVNLPSEVATRRLIGFLARRGYSGTEVYQTVDAVVSKR